jgi:hypothetical protein
MGWRDEQNEETTELQGTVRAIGKDAFLLELTAVDRNVWDEGEEVWVPYSEVQKCDVNVAELSRGDEIIVEIPEWLAKKKELVP